MRHLLPITFLFTLLLLAACGSTAPTQTSNAPAAAPGPGFATISVSDLKARLESETPPRVLDVRTPEEFVQDRHIPGATLIPLQELGSRMGELTDKNEPIACFCRSGNRSTTACQQLAAAGYTNLVNVEGGINAWKAAGYPVE
ncbi:MAG: rhodanese-like domain-containing protein [Oscillochloridaceae bacterium umkhey_bin13]